MRRIGRTLGTFVFLVFLGAGSVLAQGRVVEKGMSLGVAGSFSGSSPYQYLLYAEADRQYTGGPQIGYAVSDRFEIQASLQQTWARRPEIGLECSGGPADYPECSPLRGAFTRFRHYFDVGVAYAPFGTSEELPVSLQIEAGYSRSAFDWGADIEGFDAVERRLSIYRLLPISQRVAFLPSAEGMVYEMMRQFGGRTDRTRRYTGVAFGAGLIYGPNSSRPVVVAPRLVMFGGAYTLKPSVCDRAVTAPEFQH